MVPADNLRDAGPGKFNSGHDLMTDNRVVGHLTKFLRIKRGGFAEQPLIHRDFADVMQVAGRAQTRNLSWPHTHGFADRGRITPNPQRMAVNVDVLHVNGCSEGL